MVRGAACCTSLVDGKSHRSPSRLRTLVLMALVQVRVIAGELVGSTQYEGLRSFRLLTFGILGNTTRRLVRSRSVYACTPWLGCSAWEAENLVHAGVRLLSLSSPFVYIHFFLASLDDFALVFPVFRSSGFCLLTSNSISVVFFQN